MTGKDLLIAMNSVDEAIVAEAEEYSARQILKLHSARWYSTLAACICLLVCWAVVAQTGLFDSRSKNASMDSAGIEGAPETNETTGAGIAHDNEDACEEEIRQETAEQLIIYSPPVEYDGEAVASSTEAPENGSVILSVSLQATLNMVLSEKNSVEPLLAVQVCIYSEKTLLPPDNPKYIDGLDALGYEMHTLTDDNGNEYRCLLLTAEQLRDLAAPTDCGYVIDFARTDNGSAP